MNRDANQDLPQTTDPIGDLAIVLANWARKQPQRLKTELAKLSDQDQVELALRLPAESRLELCLHAPQPMKLVRQLPDGEFHRTVRGVEPTEAMPLMALSSASQVMHLLDLECWRKDRFDAARAGAWIAVLIDSGDETLTRLLRHADDELLALLLVQWLQLRPIESDENAEVKGSDLSEMGDEEGLVTPDGFYRFEPLHPEHNNQASRFLRQLFSENSERYSTLLWLATTELPSVLEVAALKWRDSRLEEHGWPDFEEAHQIYSDPPKAPVPPKRSDMPEMAGKASRLPFRLDAQPNWLVQLKSHPEREWLLFELGAIANRVCIADQMDIGDPEAHKLAMSRACAMVQLSLEHETQDAHQALSQKGLMDRFREGWEYVTSIGEKALELKNNGWPSTHPEAIKLLDPPLDLQIDALLQPRPNLILIDPEGEIKQREFQSKQDLEVAQQHLRLAEMLGHVFFARLGLMPESILGPQNTPAPKDHPRFSTLFLTLLVHWQTQRAHILEALSIQQLRPFLKEIAHHSNDPAKAREVADELIESLIAIKSVDPQYELLLKKYAQACLAQMHEHLSKLDPEGHLEPAWIGCLLLESMSHPKE